MYLPHVVVGTLEGVGHATFGGAKTIIQKSELVVLCETQQKFTLMSAFPPPSPLFPVLAFAASVKNNAYSRAGTDTTVLLRSAMYLIFCPSTAPSVGA